MDDAPALTFRPPQDGDAAALGQLGLTGVDVVLVGVRADGEVAAAAAVQPTEVALVGGQLLTLYAGLPADLPARDADALLSATYRLLDDAFDPQDADAPIGLCLLIEDRAEMRRRPQAHWEDPPMLYVGYLGDRRQVRVAYFDGALLRPAAAS